MLASRLKRALWQVQEMDLANMGITVPQWLVLARLASGEVATLTGLAQTLGYDAGFLSRVIQQLRQKELIAVTHDTDRRRTPLGLSDAGKAMWQSIAQQAGQTSIGAALGHHQVAQLKQMMELATRLLGDGNRAGAMPATGN